MLWQAAGAECAGIAPAAIIATATAADMILKFILTLPHRKFGVTRDRGWFNANRF